METNNVNRTKKISILGIEFAPLSLPMERRLQTLGVLYFVLSFFPIGVAGAILLIMLLFTPFFWVSLLYFTWMYYDRKSCCRGGKRSQWVRSWRIWTYYSQYFPLKLIKTEDLPTDKNYIFACHPHGIFCFSHFANFATESTGFSEKFPGISPHLITLNFQFYSPFHREMFQKTGACSASRESIEYILKKKGTGNGVAIIIGGAREALETIPNTMILTLRKRKGFIKLALKNGASLVPVISFGENDLYNTTNTVEPTLFKRIQEKLLNMLSFSIPVFFGRGIFQYSFGWMPFRKPVTTVIGKAIHVTKTPEPTQEEIDQLHERYIQELTELYEQNKDKYGYKDVPLKIK